MSRPTWFYVAVVICMVWGLVLATLLCYEQSSYIHQKRQLLPAKWSDVLQARRNYRG